jgi:hypothetical protein
MILTDPRHKIKSLPKILDRKDAYMAILITLTAIISYMLGMLSARDTSGIPVTIKNSGAVIESVEMRPTPVSTSAVIPTGGAYVASKSSTKYHLPRCPGAQRIAEANKIWFATKAEAEKAGYTPAANCPGI